MKKLLLFGILLSTFTTCQKQNQDVKVSLPPIPSFVVHNDNCKAPCGVLFFNTTKGTYDTEYIWTFGDGDSSRLDSPQHYYFSGGKYTVQLIAKNKLGFNTQNKQVTIQSDLSLSLFSLCRVDRITYLKIPLTNPEGKPWDNLPGNSALPELQWLVRDTTRIFIRGQELSDLVNFDSKLLPFTVPREGLSGSLRQFGQYYTIIVQDADVDGFELIGSFKFRPIDYFPAQPNNPTSPTNPVTEFTLKSPNGLEIVVTLGWQ
jgi:PKD repeat protein